MRTFVRLVLLATLFCIVQAQSSDGNKRKVMRFKDIQYPYEFTTLTDPSICNGKRVLMIVKSAANQFEFRQLIRQTWAETNSLPSDYLVLFIIGATNDMAMETQLDDEHYQFSDLIRYTIEDTYRNLVLKTYALYEWQQYYCPNAKYLVPIDDDIVIDLDRLDHFIKKEFDSILQAHNEEVYFGEIYYNYAVVRDPESKWYVNESSYAPKNYPTYCVGGTMVVSSKAVSKIIPETKNHNIVQVEDAFFSGIVRDALGIYTHNPAMFCEGKRGLLHPPCPDGPGSVPRVVQECELNKDQMVEKYEKLLVLKCSAPTSNLFSFTILSTFVFVKIII